MLLGDSKNSPKKSSKNHHKLMVGHGFWSIFRSRLMKWFLESPGVVYKAVRVTFFQRLSMAGKPGTTMRRPYRHIPTTTLGRILDRKARDCRLGTSGCTEGTHAGGGERNDEPGRSSDERRTCLLQCAHPEICHG